MAQEENRIIRYKVTLFTKYFETPTSLSCENIITYAYINAENISEVKDRIYRRFNDRKEILKIEEYTI
jgi:hypothetical protein